MKNNYVIFAVIIIGIGALFFFPSPASNFLAYIGTALFFIIAVILLFRWKYVKGKT
jgi:hypothetical protein